MLEKKEKPKNLDPIYIDSNKFTATYEFSNMFYEHIKGRITESNTVVVLCIGSDRATGDSLGPLIGYKLSTSKEVLNEKIILYGTLESPVHAKNLSETISAIYSQHEDPFVIAIDACLGRVSYIGYLGIGEGSLCPGAGIKKELPSIGDVYIIGIVNSSTISDIVVLQNTRLSVVMKMADVISNALLSVFQKIYDEY